MTNGRLLDTNFVITFVNGESGARNYIQDMDVAVPSIVLGELYFSAYKSVRVAENIAQIENFARIRRIIDYDAGTARIYGQIKNQLKTEGRPIPEHDIWIAAIALQYNLVLVTQDRHFEQVDRLQTESW